VSRHRPELLRDRIPCGEEEEFLSWHFPSGERRDAARLLWRLPENQFDVDLRGLHPDDDLSSVIHGGGYGSLNTVELVMALEELVDSEVANEAVEEDLAQVLGTFRQMVDRMTRNAPRAC
jgi:acyl carrier protein